jgi:CHAP domain
MRYLFLTAIVFAATPLGAADVAVEDGPASPRRNVLQCVPYARDVTGIRIRGDAHTWWGQADGLYARGERPRVGAVMNFRPHGKSRLGHVAAVSRLVDSRTVLIRHANWSSPGRIENDVRAIDVSPDNDWSQVRVWNGKAQRLGGGVWPLYGFIYNEKPGKRTRPGRIDPRSITYAQDPIGAIIAGRR